MFCRYQNRRTKWKRQTAVGIELLAEAGNMAAFQSWYRSMGLTSWPYHTHQFLNASASSSHQHHHHVAEGASGGGGGSSSSSTRSLFMAAMAAMASSVPMDVFCGVQKKEDGDGIEHDRARASLDAALINEATSGDTSPTNNVTSLSSALSLVKPVPSYNVPLQSPPPTAFQFGQTCGSNHTSPENDTMNKYDAEIDRLTPGDVADP